MFNNETKSVKPCNTTLARYTISGTPSTGLGREAAYKPWWEPSVTPWIYLLLLHPGYTPLLVHTLGIHRCWYTPWGIPLSHGVYPGLYLSPMVYIPGYASQDR